MCLEDMESTESEEWTVGLDKSSQSSQNNNVTLATNLPVTLISYI